MQCSKCGLPLCGPQCEDGPVHAPECAVLARAQPRVEVTEQDSWHPVYSAVAPLRLLAVRRQDPATWAMVDRLMDHLAARRREPRWDFVREEVVPLIVARCGEQVEAALLERIIGIFRTNSVKWEARGGEAGRWRPVGHALCPLFSVLG